MKQLRDLEAYYKDVYAMWLTYRDEDTQSRFNMLNESLYFIYGDAQCNALTPIWRQEALNEFYG